MQQQQQDGRQTSYQEHGQSPHREEGHDKKEEGAAKDRYKETQGTAPTRYETAKERYGAAPERTQKKDETPERKGKDKRS